MNRLITSTSIPARAVKIEALANMTASFESFCLASGIEALAEMMENDARTACGPRHARNGLGKIGVDALPLSARQRMQPKTKREGGTP